MVNTILTHLIAQRLVHHFVLVLFLGTVAGCIVPMDPYGYDNPNDPKHPEHEPDPVLALNAINLDQSIVLTWRTVYEEDLVGIQICRTTDSCDSLDTTCEPIRIANPESNAWEDNSVTSGETYCYRFYVYDTSDLYSIPTDITITFP
jgi:hypothetical protein